MTDENKKQRATPDQVRGMLRFQAQQEDAQRRRESKKLSDNIMNVAMGKHGITDIRDTLKKKHRCD